MTDKEKIIDKEANILTHLTRVKELLMEEDAGEITIHWKGNGISIKFSKWIKSSILTTDGKSD